LLSFAYALPRHDIESALESAGLDPAAGFLHTDRSGWPSFAIDPTEELRAALADRLLLTGYPLLDQADQGGELAPRAQAAGRQASQCWDEEQDRERNVGDVLACRALRLSVADRRPFNRVEGPRKRKQGRFYR